MSAAITQSAAWAGQILLSFSRQPLSSCVLKPRKCLKELTQFLILWYKYTLYWWPDQALESFIGFFCFLFFFSQYDVSLGLGMSSCISLWKLILKGICQRKAHLMRMVTRGVTERWWSVVRTDCPSRFGTHVVRGSIAKCNYHSVKHSFKAAVTV